MRYNICYNANVTRPNKATTERSQRCQAPALVLDDNQETTELTMGMAATLCVGMPSERTVAGLIVTLTET
jgi:hypothetical protein